MDLRINLDDWPIFRVEWPRGQTSSETLSEFLVSSKRALQTGEVHGVIHDCRTVMGMSAADRQRMATFLKENEREIHRNVCGVAIVTPNAIVRGMITAVSWLARTAAPQKTLATTMEAEAWIASRYREHTGADLPRG